jgi:hypothetical protein
MSLASSSEWTSPPGEAPTPAELQAARFAEIAQSAEIDIASFRFMPPDRARDLLPREIWQGILREGTLAILGGESKARKSWFSLAFAMAATAGGDFLGRAIMPPMTGQRRVRVLDFELLHGNVVSRFVAMAEKYDGAVEIWERIDIRSHREMMSEAQDWIGYAAWHALQLQPGDVLVVDCLQALDVGENNDPGVIRRALGRLQAAATTSGACVLVVDHFNKSGEARGKNRLSGSMAKAATPDAILLLEADGPLIRLSAELRMDPPTDPLTLEFRHPSEGFRLVGDEEREARRESAKAAKAADKLAMLFPPDQPGPASKAQLATRAGKTPDTVKAWLRELGDAVVACEQGGNRPTLYSLAARG